MSKKNRWINPMNKFANIPLSIPKRCDHVQEELPLYKVGLDHKVTLGGHLNTNIDYIRSDAILSLNNLPFSIFGFENLQERFNSKIYYYFIPDMDIPNNINEFKTALEEIINCVLKKNKSLHICCIGGHGRTGIVTACLLGMLGVKTPIKFIRKNYCEKAVESYEQEKFIFDFLNVPNSEREYTFKKFVMPKIGFNSRHYYNEYYPDDDIDNVYLNLNDDSIHKKNKED